MNIKSLLLFLVALICVSSCKKKDGAVSGSTKPTDLVINAVVSEDGSGKVNFTSTAKNAVRYNYFFGTSQAEQPTESADGKASVTYKESGTYSVRVIAYSVDNDNAIANKEVIVNVMFKIPTAGYTTPATYTGMKLAWADEFAGTTLNDAFWTQEIGNNTGWGNQELEYYQPQNTTVNDGYLTITAKKEAVNGFQYSSSRIKTQDKKVFKYGRIDIRALLPHGQGVWPALWMLGNNITTVNWPKCGDVDIMELIGGSAGGKSDSKIYGTSHWDAGGYASYGGNYTLPTGTFSDEFHVFSLVWDDKFMTWYIDDHEFHKIDITPSALDEFQKEFFILFNVAVGGQWPGNPDATTVFPQRMIVDYIRVFQKP